MKTAIVYNKGKGNFEKIVRNIYIKYVYKGKNKDFFAENMESAINLASTKSDLQGLITQCERLKKQGLITEQEYNYYINLIYEKLEGIE